MAAEEVGLLFTITADNKQALRAVDEAYLGMARETQAAETLQRQRSSALIAQWNKDNAAVETLQKQRSSALISAWNAENAASATLQKQRSAALISEWRSAEKAVASSGSALLKGASETDQLIEKSQAAIRAAESVALGAENVIGRTTTHIKAAEQEVASLTGSLSSAASTLAPFAIGLAAIGLAVGAVGFAVTKLVKNFAEYAGHLQDLSQKTGIGVETLSALKIAAENSGSSLDTASMALGRYLKSISDAEHGNKTLAAGFKQVGFTTDEMRQAHANNDVAIQLLVKHVGSYSNEQDRLNALTKLGVRNGQDLNGIITEMGGNLVKFQATMAELGLVITPEQAKAADKFNDTLHILEIQIQGIGFVIAKEVMPAIQSALDDLSGALSGQKGDWASWGQYIRGQVDFVHAEMAGLAAFARKLKEDSNLHGPGNLWLAIGAGADAESAVNAAAAKRDALAKWYRENPELDPNAAPLGAVKGGGPQLGDKPDKSGANEARKKAAEEYRVALKAAADAEKDLQIANQTNTRNNKEELDKQTIDLDEFTKNAKRYNEDLQKAAEARLDQETAATNVALQKKVISQVQYNEKQKELLTQRKEEEEKFNAQDQALENARLKGNAQAAQANRDRIYASQVAADNRLLAEDKRLADEGYITFAEAEARKEEIEKTAYERTKAKLNEELIDQETSAERRKAIIQELADLDNDYQNQVRDNIDKTAKARQKDIDEQQRQFDELQAIRQRLMEQQAEERRQRQLKDPTSDRSLFGDDFQQALDMGMSKLGAFSEMAGSIFDQLSKSAGNFGTMMYDVFQGIGQAVGNAVKSFVLLGTAGTSFRKFAAEVIAGVAQMAATKAVFELAEGFAALARAFFGDPKAAAEATLHFHSAAIYGSVAAIAAIAGRGIAGDSFKSQGASGGSGGSASTGTSGGSTTQNQPPDTIRQGRFGGSQSEQRIVLEILPTRDATIRHIKDDIKGNGEVRDLMVKIAGGT